MITTQNGKTLPKIMVKILDISYILKAKIKVIDISDDINQGKRTLMVSMQLENSTLVKSLE